MLRGRIVIKGTMEGIKTEELRAMVMASMTVCEFHNKTLMGGNDVTVTIVTKKELNKDHDGNAIGDSNRAKRAIRIVDFTENPNVIFTNVIHEVLHLYFDLPWDRTEYATCKLVNRLAPTIVEIYESLAEGVYQRAGYIAHAKISYVPEGDDDYDDCQWDVPDVPEIVSITEQRKNEAMAVEQTEDNSISMKVI